MDFHPFLHDFTFIVNQALKLKGKKNNKACRFLFQSLKNHIQATDRLNGQTPQPFSRTTPKNCPRLFAEKAGQPKGTRKYANFEPFFFSYAILFSLWIKFKNWKTIKGVHFFSTHRRTTCKQLIDGINRNHNHFQKRTLIC